MAPVYACCLCSAMSEVEHVAADDLFSGLLIATAVEDVSSDDDSDVEVVEGAVPVVADLAHLIVEVNDVDVDDGLGGDAAPAVVPAAREEPEEEPTRLPQSLPLSRMCTHDAV